MIEVVNRQRKTRIDKEGLASFCNVVSRTVSETGGRPFTVAIVSDRRMRRLNRDFRGIDRTTDVLSFTFEDDQPGDMQDHLGDIAISAETAERQATENGLEMETEHMQLILHGVLHLSGFDHETDDGEMDRLERRYRKVLGIDE